MFFKNAQIYRLPQNYDMTAERLSEVLKPQEFRQATSAELSTMGWASPTKDDTLVHAVNRQLLINLQTEKKLLPATVVNQVAKSRALEMEEAQGFAPGKKAMKELKERVADELLPRAFSLLSTTAVWIDPINGWLVVDAASPAKADEVVKLLLKARVGRDYGFFREKLTKLLITWKEIVNRHNSLSPRGYNSLPLMFFYKWIDFYVVGPVFYPIYMCADSILSTPAVLLNQLLPLRQAGYHSNDCSCRRRR